MGTSRIPWKGMSKVDMVIQPTDPTKLPVAHTCFNLLDLPSIEDKDELLRRLRICIDNNQGFTLAAHVRCLINKCRGINIVL